ncbi:MAG: hypothetical protein IJ623_09955 [Bacteroidales bacterium]|nr:hypothetical protein [Bacteroidales bacterium]
MLEGVLYQVVEKTEGTARVRLLGDSIVYKSHFPGFPVTPGVTLVQIALECMGRSLKGAKDIKFTVPVLPQAEEIELRWTVSEDGEALVNLFLKDGTPCAKMTLSV